MKSRKGSSQFKKKKKKGKLGLIMKNQPTQTRTREGQAQGEMFPRKSRKCFQEKEKFKY